MAQRTAVRAIQATFRLSERRACGLRGAPSGRPCANASTPWRPSAAVLAIADSISCSDGRAIV